MTVVVGTAGHIDHGKTTLLRALTGIDADRLPEERRRGMTIDVGYAWLTLPDGEALDFVDVPGHDRLVGNMLVGAGEIDAALLVVAADDGPRAQTIEHLELLDALGIAHGVVAITKADLVPAVRSAEVAGRITALLAATSLAGSPVVIVSAAARTGLDHLLAALVALRDRVRATQEVVGAQSATIPGRTRVAIDRAFPVRGRGVVVTGSLRGGPLGVGAMLRLLPDGGQLRAREVQVHGSPVASAGPGGRVALNVVAADRARPRRGAVLTDDPRVVPTTRLLVALRPARHLAGGTTGPRPAVPTGTRVRLHLGTTAVDAIVRRGRRDEGDLPDGEGTAILRLVESVAAASGDRFVLRRPSPAEPLAGGRILDPFPPAGAPWRRATRTDVAALATATTPADLARARLALHGALARSDPVIADLPAGSAVPVGHVVLAPGLAATIVDQALAAVRASDGGIAVAELRSLLGRGLLRGATLTRDGAAESAGALIDAVVRTGRLARSGDIVHLPGMVVGLPADVLAAMDRLERLLDVPAPPSLADAARAAGCPPDGVRALRSAGRIVAVDDDLAWASATFREMERRALDLAAARPLTPAAFRDATGTSRKYVMPLLEELDRRAVLQRTPDGHVPGPRARTAAGAPGAAPS